MNGSVPDDPAVLARADDADPANAGTVPIETGRRLIRLPQPPAQSLRQRVAEAWTRALWRTPLHAVQLRGHHPMRLLMVPADPIAGRADAGRAIRAGRFAFRGLVLPLERVDFGRLEVAAPFADHLHRFAWLRDLSAAGTRAQVAPVAEAMVRRWLAAHGDAVSVPAWSIANAGWRLLNWLANAPVILSSNDPVYRSAVLTAFARTARHLDRQAPRERPGVEAVVGWCAVITAGLALPGGEPRRLFGEQGLRAALGSALFDDGGNIQRSPMAQIAVIEAMAMLAAAYAARQVNPPDYLAVAQARAVPALLALVHGDGGLGAWAGAGGVGPEVIEAVVAASGVRARPLRDARDWGYQRVTARRTVLMVDAAPPPAQPLGRGQMATGCAGTLAFELSEGAHRIIVNCGGAGLTGAFVPDDLARGLRSTAAHSTLVIDDTNSTAILASGALGAGVGVVDVERRESDGGSRLEASHDGYARRFGMIHRRLLMLGPSGRELRGEDVLLPSARARRTRRAKADIPFAIRFHLAPGVVPVVTGDTGLIPCPEGPTWRLRAAGGTLFVEDSLWVDGDGRPHPTHQLVIHGLCPTGGISIGWLMRHAD